MDCWRITRHPEIADATSGLETALKERYRKLIEKPTVPSDVSLRGR